MPRFVIDSWAWVEYLDGTERGGKARKIIMDEANEVYANPVSIAEVISIVRRKGMDADFAFNAIADSSMIISLDESFCKDAGIFHGDIRKTIKDFGLGDAFVAVSANRLNARIVTGDPHFKGFKNAVMI